MRRQTTRLGEQLVSFSDNNVINHLTELGIVQFKWSALRFTAWHLRTNISQRLEFIKFSYWFISCNLGLGWLVGFKLIGQIFRQFGSRGRSGWQRLYDVVSG